jgi:hypothetical protein
MKMNYLFEKNSVVTFLDMFSITGNVKIQGMNTYSYRLSMTLSLICLISIITISFYFVIFFFQRSSSLIMFNMDSMEYPLNNLTEFPFTFQLYDSYGRLIPDQDKYFYLSCKFWKYKVTKDENNQPKIINDLTDIQLQRCDINKHFGNFQKFYSDVPDLNTKYCLPPNSHNLTLYGFYGDVVNGFSFLSLFVHRCINGVDGRSDCYDINKIDEALVTVHLEVSFMNSDIDHSNPKDPRVMVRKTTTHQMSSSIYRKISKYFAPVQYSSDYGYIFEDKFNLYFPTHESDEIEYDFRKEGVVKGSFSTLTFVNSSKTHKYKRSFAKLQALFANIGGIINGINVIARIINYILSRNLINFVLFESAFKSSNVECKNIKEKIKGILVKSIENRNKNVQFNESLKNFNKSHETSINVCNINKSIRNPEAKK